MSNLFKALTLVSCAALSACSAMEDPTAGVSVPTSLAKWIIVSPAAPTVAPGASVALHVEMQDETGTVVTGQPEEWATSDSSIATVSTVGVVTARVVGAARITVASGRQSAYVDVSVSTAPVPPRWVSIDPATAQLAAHTSLRIFGTVSDADGHAVTNVPVTWSSSNTTVAIVDTGGVVTGMAPGNVNIIAHASTNSATARLTITAANPGSPATPPPLSSSGTLYNDFSTTSPHWQHIRSAITDFYARDGWSSGERVWVGHHYDMVMSGDGAAWRAVNPTVQHYPYVLLQATLLPHGAVPNSPASEWYEDAKGWYSAHPQFNLESAFLHRAGQAADSAHRLQPFGWDTYTWIINPGDPGLIEYQMDRFRRLVANENGLFIDSQGSGDLLKNLKDGVSTSGSLEYPNSTGWPPSGRYFSDYSALLLQLKSAVGSKTLQPNTSGYDFNPDFADVTASGATHMEKANNPLSTGLPATWSWIDKLVAAGVYVNFVSDYDYVDAKALAHSFGNVTADSAYYRLKMGELASYYMVVPQQPDHIELQLINMWDHPASVLWLKPQEANIGHPVEPRRRVSSGIPTTDPASQQVAIYKREFDRALVVFRPQTGWSTQRYDDATAVTVPLPAGTNWLPLLPDGTLGAPVLTVKLRNAESVILVKANTI